MRNWPGGHKYFCKKANMSVFSTQVEAAPQLDNDKGDILLQVMKIHQLDGKGRVASSLFYGTCTCYV